MAIELSFDAANRASAGHEGRTRHAEGAVISTQAVSNDPRDPAAPFARDDRPLPIGTLIGGIVE